MEIAFIENQGDATLVLPEYNDPEAEPEDDELEAAAGEMGLALMVSLLQLMESSSN